MVATLRKQCNQIVDAIELKEASDTMKRPQPHRDVVLPKPTALLSAALRHICHVDLDSKQRVHCTMVSVLHCAT